MSCAFVREYRQTVGTVALDVADWVGMEGLWLVRIHVTNPVRIVMDWSLGKLIREQVTFDVVSHESLVLPMRHARLTAYAHPSANTSDVVVSFVETAAWAKTEVELHLHVPAGSTDSDVTTALKPPRGAVAVLAAPDDADDYHLKLYDPTSTRVGSFTRGTLPQGGASLGRSSRVVVEADGPLRLTYRIAL